MKKSLEQAPFVRGMSWAQTLRNAHGYGGIHAEHSIVHRKDFYENWFEHNPVLLKNEYAWDMTNFAMKIGDGHTAWRDLPYALRGESP